jgi:hypothetical protein
MKISPSSGLFFPRLKGEDANQIITMRLNLTHNKNIASRQHQGEHQGEQGNRNITLNS